MAQEVGPAGLRVTRKPQPVGEAGTAFSLQQVARLASVSRLEVAVRAWALRKCRDAGYPKDDIGKARAIFAGMKADGIEWISDPDKAEWMANAKHMVASADGADDALFVAGDCDDLTILYLAAFMAACQTVGVKQEFCAVLGHSYSRDRALSHVLAAIWDGRRWWRVDPSGDWGFGDYKQATREVMISLPSERLMCDRETCASGAEAVRPLASLGAGEFVAVEGLSGLGSVQAQVFDLARYGAGAGAGNTLGDAASADTAASSTAAQWTDLMRASALDLADSWNGVVDAFDGLSYVQEQLGESLASMGWTSEWQTTLDNTGRVVKILVDAALDAANGKRRLLLLPGGDWGIELLSTDKERIINDGEKTLAIVDIAIAGVNGIGDTLGLGPVAIAGLIAVGAGVQFLIAKVYTDTIRSVVEKVTQYRINKMYADCADKWDPERCGKLSKIIANGQVKVKDADTRNVAETNKAPGLDGASKVLVGVAAVGAVGAVVAGVVYLIKQTPSAQRRAAA